MIYPKIGIRPVIDGRQFGVSVKIWNSRPWTWHMQRQKLIESRLRYPDGTKVQCVIAPKTIGGGAEAYECETFFRHRTCATLSVTPCWCYVTETMDLNPLTIKAVWGFNGTERPGAVYLAYLHGGSCTAWLAGVCHLRQRRAGQVAVRRSGIRRDS